MTAADVAFAPTLKATVELFHSDFIPPKRFNDDPAVFASPYPLLPDPRHTGLNETHIAWTPSADWSARLGRQSVKLGDERHLSDDNFRHVPLLFDGLLLRGQPISHTLFTIGQSNRSRTRGGSVEPLQLTFAELTWKPRPDLSAPVYALRHRPKPNPFDMFRFGVGALSNQVVGIVADGSYSLGAGRGYYTLNVADQRSDGDEARLRARYWRAGVRAWGRGGADGSRAWTTK